MNRFVNKPWAWLVVCAGLLAAADAFAALEAGPAGALTERSGRITMVDPRNGVILVEQQEFRIDSQTAISDGQRQLTLDHLLPGQEVVVRYTPGDAHQPVAQSVIVTQPSPSAATTSPSASGPITQGSTPATP